MSPDMPVAPSTTESVPVVPASPSADRPANEGRQNDQGKNRNKGKGKKGKGQGGKGGNPENRFLALAPIDVSDKDAFAMIDALAADESLLQSGSDETETLTKELQATKLEFLQKCDRVLALRAQWKAEAENLQKSKDLTPDQRLRQAVLTQRLALGAHYVIFQKIIGEIEELKQKRHVLNEEQRKDAMRLKVVKDYPDITPEKLTEKQTEATEAESAFQAAKADAEANPNDAEKEKKRREAEEKTKKTKGVLETYQKIGGRSEHYRRALITRMEKREVDIKKETDALAESDEKLKQTMIDLAVLERQAGNIEKDPPSTFTAQAEASSGGSATKAIHDAIGVVGKGTVRTAKVGGVAALGVTAIAAGAVAVGARFFSVQMKRLYNFTMNPSVMGKGFDRMKKMYQDQGAWNGTGEAIKWLLMGDPESEQKKHDKK